MNSIRGRKPASCFKGEAKHRAARRIGLRPQILADACRNQLVSLEDVQGVLAKDVDRLQRRDQQRGGHQQAVRPRASEVPIRMGFLASRSRSRKIDLVHRRGRMMRNGFANCLPVQHDFLSGVYGLNALCTSSEICAHLRACY